MKILSVSMDRYLSLFGVLFLRLEFLRHWLAGPRGAPPGGASRFSPGGLQQPVGGLCLAGNQPRR
jgi:hypothetical protein